jgi:hypothetical protein
MCCLPVLAVSAGRLRKTRGEDRLWTALTVTGFLAPFTWVVVLLIALAHSDI